jgi:hypothetical protein
MGLLFSFSYYILLFIFQKEVYINFYYLYVMWYLVNYRLGMLLFLAVGMQSPQLCLTGKYDFDFQPSYS